MVSPTRSILFVAALLIFGVPGYAQVFPLECRPNVSQVNYRNFGNSERVSDLYLICTGGVSTAAQQTVPMVTLSLTFNTPVTSRSLAPGWSEALLVIDEPQVPSQRACTTEDGICSITGGVTPSATYSGAEGHPNIFQGSFGPGGKTLTWTFPFDPPGPVGSRRLRFVNLRVATATTIPTTVDGAIRASITYTSPLSINFINSNQTLAEFGVPITGVNPIVTEAVGGRLTTIAPSIREGYPNAFKPRSADGTGPPVTPQAAPGGAPLDYETGFFNPALPSTARGNLARAGVADTGTRIRITLSRLSTGVLVTVPSVVKFGTGSAQLISTDSTGVGPYQPAESAPLKSEEGSVHAVYEITASASGAIETITFPIRLSYPVGSPTQEPIPGLIAVAPFSADETPTGSAIPRFSGNLGFSLSIPRLPFEITTSSLPDGVVGVPYSLNIEATGGIAPYNFPNIIVPAPGVPTNGLGINVNGTVFGTPLAAGVFLYRISATDAGRPITTPTEPRTQQIAFRDLTMTVHPAGTGLRTSLSTLSFPASAGAAAAAMQTLRISSQDQGRSFSVAIDSGTPGSSAPTWIQVSPQSGGVPSFLSVLANPGNLPAGTYSARILISMTGTTLPPTVVPVTFLVGPATPAKLESATPLLTFSVPRSSPTKRQGVIQVRSQGSTDLSFAAIAVQRSTWISSITPTSAAATSSGTAVQVDIDPAGLPEGIYRDVVRLTSPANTIDVPVLLRVNASGPQIDLSATGVRFSMPQGTATLTTRTIRVLDHDSTISVPWTAEWIKGSEYLTLSSTPSTSAEGSGSISLAPKAETSSLAAGAYYGLLRVTANGAPASARYVTVVLHVAPAAQPAELDLDSGGFVVTVPAGSSEVPIPRTVRSSNATQLTSATLNGNGWLSVSPTSQGPNTFALIAVDPRALTAGIYRGEITFSSTDTSRILPVTLIVTAASCIPRRIAVTSRSLAGNFTLPSGWPAPLDVEVRDDCGAPVTNATVSARFSNGDPSITLEADDAGGVYFATWQPGFTGGQTNVTISASSGAFQTSTTLVGSVTENRVPTLSRGGTIHNLDPKPSGLLAPGLVAQIYGSGLAAISESTGTVPLSNNYKGTSVLVGPYEAPLYYVSPEQLVVQLPNELPPNQRYPVVIVRGSVVTVPDQIDVVAVQPGVAAFADGRIIAQHADFSLVDARNPARRGEFLVMYLAGLGSTSPAVITGVPSPGTSPLPVLTSRPVVSVDGATAELVYAGLTPSGIGLYQVNFKVPDNARLNVPLDVIVKQGAYTANITTLTVTQ